MTTQEDLEALEEFITKGTLGSSVELSSGHMVTIRTTTRPYPADIFTPNKSVTLDIKNVSGG